MTQPVTEYDDLVRDMLQGIRELDHARPELLQAHSFFEGELPEIFANERLADKLAGLVKDYEFRFARKPVTGMANRLRIGAMVSTSEAEQTALDELRRVNLMQVQEAEIILRCLEFGTAYALVDPFYSEPDDDEPDEVPRITFVSPLHARAVYDRDGLTILYVVHSWVGADKKRRADVWYDDQVVSFVTINEAAMGAGPEDPQGWAPYVEDGAADNVTPYPEGVPREVPIKHARTSLVHGRPVHRDAYGPQNAITKTLLTLVDSIEEQGWPARYALQDVATQLDANADGPDWEDDASAPTAGQRYTGDLAVDGLKRGAGQMDILQGVRSVGEWKVALPREIVEPIELLIRSMATVTDTPLWELDPTVLGGGQTSMSGIAFRRADAPAQAMADRLAVMLGLFFRELYGYALQVWNGGDPEIDVRWAPPGVESDPEFWQIAATKAELGVPQSDILTEANYLPEQVQAWSDEEGDSMALLQRVRILDQLGGALQKIAQAQALMPDVLDSAALQALVSRVMEGVGGEGGDE